MKDADIIKMFEDLPARRAERNKAMLTMDQIMMVKTARANRYTPKELEQLTGLSVYRIHQIINMKTVEVKEEINPNEDIHYSSDSDDDDGDGK